MRAVRGADTQMKLSRVMRYQHLGRDYVDEDDYPPSQEYFLYADSKVRGVLPHIYLITDFVRAKALTSPMFPTAGLTFNSKSY